ncbi:MAG: DUF167 domain-containing protein [Myxococcaceae bacterium]|nr:DUF167 domain-containing protein [Myxococcaceae bacterium]
MSWAKDVDGDVELLVLVQPRASRRKVVGEHDGRLKIALAAPPVDGEANAALVEFLAEALGVKRSAVELVDGLTGRRKRVRVSGLARIAASPRLVGSRWGG